MLPYFQHNSCSEVSNFLFPSTLYQQDLPNPDNQKPAGHKRSCYNFQPQEDHLVIMDNGVDKEKKKKKMVHRETEKKRRQEMSNLSSSLRSLLPLHLIKAVNYIKHLEEKTKELSIKRDKLKKMCNVVTDAEVVLKKNDKSERVMVKCSQNPITVTVSCSEGGIEILVKSFINENKGLQISRVLKTLVHEGIDVISCNSTKINDTLLIYTIHSKAHNCRDIKTPIIQFHPCWDALSSSMPNKKTNFQGNLMVPSGGGGQGSYSGGNGSNSGGNGFGGQNRYNYRPRNVNMVASQGTTPDGASTSETSTSGQEDQADTDETRLPRSQEQNF
ncbi:Myc-type, basic helix-loop-helix (bHLH) domain-containing protein [Artemisia annua]|uniref:Myc-type, basic helix-loop-helix (BHLH) domain-containing protein n=1 Tax=Artemisia annua TaxID=35608 RepID=A0A2U1KEV0_ARTAN|nr:Myc-type, basic helix-loop-helix (bHLH) domain-containing protein [Artemisia annua]